MVNEQPAAVSVLDKHRQKAAERKGRRSLEVIPPPSDTGAAGSSHKSKGPAGPTHRSKKRPTDVSNIATTTRSPGSMPTPPPSRRVAAEAVTSSPGPLVRGAAEPSKVDARAAPTPFDLLGGGYRFSRRVCVALPDEARDSLQDVSPSDLLKSGFELMCRSVVLFQSGLVGRERQAEEVSALEHKLSEANHDLEQSLAANTNLSALIATEAAEKELVRREAAEAKRQLEAEKLRAAAEIANLRKLVEEKDGQLSASATEMAALQLAKEQAEVELDENYEEAEELLKQCFERAVRQAHVLYGEPPATGEFDLDSEVYQGRLMSSAEVAALTAQETEPAGTEEGEAEVRGKEVEAEEGGCINIQD